MKFYTTIIALFFTSAFTSIFAQHKIVVAANYIEEGIQINWYPTNPDIWNKQLKDGYRVTRRTISAAGNAQTEVLATSLMPRDSIWFSQHQQDVQGLMEPVGALLYDPAFSFGDANDIMSENEMKFNFLVYESTQHFKIAEALGLGFVDQEVLPGKRYEYIIEANNSDWKGNITLSTEPDTYVQNVEGSVVEFEFIGGKSLSQMLYESQPVIVHEIKGLAQPMGDSIILRWGASTPEAWNRAKAEGYQIYKYKLGREPQLVTTVFPWPKEDIDDRIKNDSMALLAASLLYQKNLGQDASFNVAQKSAMFDNFHGFSLFAADRSPLAADILGLRYVDKDVEVDSVYNYYITTDFIENGYVGANVYVTNTVQPLPTPSQFEAVPQDRAIKLVWNKSENQTKFSAYYVERSEDGTQYERLHSSPLVFADSPQFPISEFFYVDSVAANNKTYYYRLTGSNSFGLWSDYVYTEGQSVDLMPPPAPQIIDALYEHSTKSLKISWKSVIAEDLDKYQVLYSSTHDGVYSAVSPLLTQEVTEYDLPVEGMNLNKEVNIKVQVYDTNGNINSSNYFSAIVPDYEDPDTPEGLQATIDTSGNVYIKWNAAQANDLRGYWVFWANSINDEMSVINDYILEDTVLKWKVDDKTLNKHMWFCVAAEDNSYNKSKMSEAIKVLRPDKVPPSPPFQFPTVVEKDILAVSWRPSASLDVEKQIVYRKKREKYAEWVAMDTLIPTMPLYLDTSLLYETVYDYRIVAIDQSGNQSKFSNQSFGKIPLPKSEVVVDDFEAKSKSGAEGRNSIRLNWTYKPVSKEFALVPVSFDIYRSTGGNIVDKITNTQALSFFDDDIVPNVLYNYAVRIRFDNGWVGDLSEIKSVMIQ